MLIAFVKRVAMTISFIFFFLVLGIVSYFNLSVDVNQKTIKIKDKLKAIIKDLPDNIEIPIIEKVDIFATPVVDLVLSSDKYDTKFLYNYADKILKQQFSSISEISIMDISGGREREIQVKLDPILMKKYYVTDIISLISAKNLNISGGNIENNKNSINIRFIGEFNDLEEIKNIMIGIRNGEDIPLKYIVNDFFSKYDKDVIYIGVNLAQGSSIENINTKIKYLEGVLNKIPEVMIGPLFFTFFMIPILFWHTQRFLKFLNKNKNINYEK